MAKDKDKAPVHLPPEPREGPLEWGGDAAADAWTQDSSLPASESLSGLPEPVEVVEEPPEIEESEEEAAAEAPTELPTPSMMSDEDASRRRSKTIARKQMMRDRRRMIAQGLLPEILDYERPGTREECRSDKRPCLYVSCRYHLYLDVNPMTGSIKINFPDREVWQLAQTCALDVAERGGITLEEVGDIMNLTRERIRQVEVSGLDKLREGEQSLETFLDGHELVVGGPTLEGKSRLPIVGD